MADLKYIKMTGGEDVIAKITKNSDGTVTLLDSIRLVMQPNMTVAFIPMFMFAKDEKNVTLPESAIRYTLDPSEDLKAEFLKKTSGLITVAPKV